MCSARSCYAFLIGFLFVTSSVSLAQVEVPVRWAPLNINNHYINIRDDGLAGYGESGSSIRHSFPVRGASGIYSEGILIGGYLRDAGSQRLWVTGSSYNTGFAPGTLLSNPSPAPNRIYRIRKDYLTADLRQDAADCFLKAPEYVTQTDIDVLRARYAADWLDWPTAYGAPFYDENNNGMRDPSEDPGLLGADMVIWYVTTDQASPALYACQPLGLETQITWWGYTGRKHALGNSMFVRYRMIYRGTPDAGPEAWIDSVYITKFADIDLGASSNDLMGCDTTLQLGYAYNGESLDDGLVLAGIHTPPALGYSLLSASALHKADPTEILRMTSFYVKGSGTPVSDPPFTEEGGRRMYRWMRGYLPDPSSAPLRTWADASGNPRFFLHTGDPVTGEGDLDGVGDFYSMAPGDRRSLMNVGPTSLGIGDSIEVVYAIVGAAGGDRIRNIDYLRWLTQYVRQAYPDLASLKQYEEEETPPPSEVPSSVTLWTNYPNPFNAGTTILYAVPDATPVRLTVYNLLGQEVKTLVDAIVQAGTHAATWNGTNAAGAWVPSGIYFYRFETGGMVVTKRMIFQK